MRKLSSSEEVIFNDGERLIPGVTHNLEEVVRHMSSYLFFKKVIETDVAVGRKTSRPVQIIDLGCGVGYGCHLLSQIPGSHILGVDNSAETLEYAQQHYQAPNINYKLADLTDFIPSMKEYYYAISRGVFEHVPNGLNLARSIRWHYRLLFDVPYNELEDKNPHHVIYEIREESFSEFPGVELFFQDLNGVIYDSRQKPANPNMIICICSDPELQKVASLPITFPFPSWQPKQSLSLKNLNWSKIIRGVREFLRG